RTLISDFVRADPGRSITLSEMAKVAGMSPSGFIRTFKRSVGVTPQRFVVEHRVDAARDLIAGSDMPSADIALAGGFSSQSHLG
ncbi:helix-turn-helix domain-containing protein, partial [Acinetobacter baumannii]|uniref:helix-turn-helix domain-containing protein n=1 Tax=Acinetobacter baumannii TaxID=470 RepID=UPI0013D6373D